MKLIRTAALAAGVVACTSGLRSHAGVVLTTLVSFDQTNGANPLALVQGTNGNFYGTTSSGGAYNQGTIFQLAPDGTMTDLASFTGGPDGGFPVTLLLGLDGNFYGSTLYGGTGSGTVFKMAVPGGLHSLATLDFTNGSGPQSLIQARDGSFFGAAIFGGVDSTGPYNGAGTLFKVATNGDYVPLFFFNGTNGTSPNQVLQSKNGDLYCITEDGSTWWFDASQDYGRVLRLGAGGALTNLVRFWGTNGLGPPALGLVEDHAGNLFGATEFGGPGFNGSVPSGRGTIFRIAPDGTFTNLVWFDGTNGAFPVVLLEGVDGNFYGVAAGGGAYWMGTAFEMAPDGRLWTLASFAGTNGATPDGALIQAADGNLYGTTTRGGAYGYGTVFRLSVPMPPVFKTLAKNGNDVSLTWSSVAGQTYQLQYATDLSQTNWNNAGSATSATNGTMTASDWVGSDAQRFYRVVLLP